MSESPHADVASDARPRAYDCWVDGIDWSHATVIETSPGRAKRERWHRIREPYPDIPYTAVRCRVAGPIEDTEAFRRTASYRGVPFAHMGMSVKVGGHSGIIVDRNDSANFDVLFFEGPNKGLRLSCHPHWMMQYFDKDGNEVTNPLRQDGSHGQKTQKEAQ